MSATLPLSVAVLKGATQVIGAAGWAGALSVLLLLPACRPARGVNFAEDDGRKSVVVEAVTGDRVRIEGETYRLVGIHAPQPAPDAGCWAEAILGAEAKEALAMELTGRVEVDRLDADPADAVRVFADGSSVSDLMIRRGLVAATTTPFDWCGPVGVGTEGAPRLREAPSASRDRPGPSPGV